MSVLCHMHGQMILYIHVQYNCFMAHLSALLPEVSVTEHFVVSVVCSVAWLENMEPES